MTIHKVVGGKQVGEMRDHCQQQQAQGVSCFAMGIVIALGDKKAHDRTGEPADDMHDDRHGSPVIAGEKKPRQMVRRHGQNSDQLEGIAVKHPVLDQFGIFCHIVISPTRFLSIVVRWARERKPVPHCDAFLTDRPERFAESSQPGGSIFAAWWYNTL